MTVAELIEQLSKVHNKHREVKIWLPGSSLSLIAVLFPSVPDQPYAVRIEATVDEGSAITFGR